MLIVAATGAWLWFAEDVACMLALLIAVHQVRVRARARASPKYLS